MLSVELVVIKTPLVQRPKNALHKLQSLRIAGIKRGGAVIANHDSLLVVEIPIRMCAQPAGIRVGHQPDSGFQPFGTDVTRQPLWPMRELGMVPVFDPGVPFW